MKQWRYFILYKKCHIEAIFPFLFLFSFGFFFFFLCIPPSVEAIYRTDFFPGLGWMLNRRIWQEFSPKWPKAYWDDWIREAQQRKGRACLQPEVPRSHTFGERGVSAGQYYKNFLLPVKLNNRFTPFTTMDLSYLEKVSLSVS